MQLAISLAGYGIVKKSLLASGGKLGLLMEWYEHLGENKGVEKADIARLKKLETESETELKALAAGFARKVPENEFSPAEIQLFWVGYRKSPATAVQNGED